jgi:HEAT repeat protein
MSPVALTLVLAAHTLGHPTLPWPALPSRAASEVALEVDRVKTAGLAVNDAALLEYFRERTPPPPAPEAIATLIRQLADKKPAVRDKAAADLIGLGWPAVSLLRLAANDAEDLEVSARARHCLEYIEGPPAADLAQAAARILAAHRPAGATPVLITFLPFADNDAVLQEVETTLVALAQHDGQVDPQLLEALKDPVPVRRGSVARVLCQGGGAVGRSAVRPLLKDPRPSVRLQAALGLAETYDAEAIPVLIELLAQLPLEGRRQAEEYLADLAGEWSVTGPAGNDRLSGRLRREAWAAWWRGADGPSLVAELRTRTLNDDDRDKVVALLRQLEDASDEVREKAVNALLDFGPRAVPLLRHAARDGGPNAAPLAAQCLEALERTGPRPLPAAALRLLTMRRPEGAVEALLAYLPFAENDSNSTHFVDLLVALGCADGKADPALVRGLADRVPSRRSAAAMALVRGRADEHLRTVRKLLKDPDAEVRLRCAVALAGRGEKDTVPVLIGLLGVLPPELAGEAIDYLVHLAGESAPEVNYGTDAKARKATVAAWEKWWKEKGPGVDLARADPLRHSGALLVIELQGPKGTGRVLEVNAAGKIRWQIEGLNYPIDAQVLPNGHVMVVEQHNRLSERTRDGKVVWEKFIPNVCQVEALPNGQMMVVTRQSLQLLDRARKPILTHSNAGGWILAARHFRDGSMAYVTYQGQYVRIDAKGKEVKSTNIPFNANFGVNGAEVLPGDRVLISIANSNKVTEYSADGKVLWEATVNNAGGPTRLANGHTLVCNSAFTTLTEVDRSGRIVSEKKDLPFHPFSVYPR